MIPGPGSPDSLSAADVTAAQELSARVCAAIHDAVEVRPEVVTHAVVAMLAEGHVLIEDLPGVGKTTLARAVARALGLTFARVQCTADLLPPEVSTALIRSWEAGS